MSVPFPPGPYKIVNYQNGNINTARGVGPIDVFPVVADSEAAVFTVSDYKPAPNETLGYEVHHLVNILKGGQPANLRLDGVSETGGFPSDQGIVAVFNNAVPNVWCIHPSDDGETNKFFRYGTKDHGPFHWHLESSKAGTFVTVNIDQDHPINKALRAHINAGRGASLSDLTQKLKVLEKHHPDCFWHFNLLN
ncbi:hypothetical protein Clacol_003292 [Clathrus columnatus]|uniref:Uncharacterized protein n=1 Tax=Clathrus columnatus TaxID=1419009 RepID=A0AAV5AAW0_9AGAM|nr:hypothetical protein Clacol_003292 [Clathrus columnatus]